MAEKMEIIEYKMGDSAFKNPEYETHVSHVLLFIFGILTASSQIAITLGVLPGAFWPIPMLAFLGGLTSFVWVYYAMEHVEGIPVLAPEKLEVPELIPAVSISEVIPDMDANSLISGIIDRLPIEDRQRLERLPEEEREELVARMVQRALIDRR